MPPEPAPAGREPFAPFAPIDRSPNPRPPADVLADLGRARGRLAALRAGAGGNADAILKQCYAVALLGNELDAARLKEWEEMVKP